MEKEPVYRDIITGKIITPEEMRKWTSGNEYSLLDKWEEEWRECPWQAKTIFAGLFIMILLAIMS